MGSTMPLLKRKTGKFQWGKLLSGHEKHGTKSHSEVRPTGTVNVVQSVVNRLRPRRSQQKGTQKSRHRSETAEPLVGTSNAACIHHFDEDTPLCLRCGQCKKTSERCQIGRWKICQSRSSFLDLPTELKQEIFRNLSPAAALSLKVCCKSLYSDLPAVKPPTFEPLTDAELLEFLVRLRPSVPPPLGLCWQCVRYHPTDEALFYTWQTSPSDVRFCLRHHDRTGEWPAVPGLDIGGTHYVCRYCRNVRPNRTCQTCAKCQTCAGVRFKGVSVECIECDDGKARCRQCHYLRPRTRACRGCGICEKCAGRLFQFECTHCADCGGGQTANIPATKKVLLETGPGYEMYYNMKAEPLTRVRRIGERA